MPERRALGSTDKDCADAMRNTERISARKIHRNPTDGCATEERAMHLSATQDRPLESCATIKDHRKYVAQTQNDGRMWCKHRPFESCATEDKGVNVCATKTDH